MEALTQLDFNILNSAQALRCAFMDWLMPLLSLFGSFAVPWFIYAAALLIKRGGRRHGFVILLAMALGLALGSGVLKNVIMRDRPFNDPRGLFDVTGLMIPPPSDRYSFPSGHAVTSFAAAAAIAMHNKKTGAAAFVLAAAIAFSRVYLYVHFPLDVVAGAVLGAACAFAARWIVDAICRRFGQL